MNDEIANTILKELQMLRKLKLLELCEAGYSQAKLGVALGVSQKTVSRLMANQKKGKGHGPEDA